MQKKIKFEFDQNLTMCYKQSKSKILDKNLQFNQTVEKVKFLEKAKKVCFNWPCFKINSA